MGSWPVTDPTFNISEWNLLDALVVSHIELNVKPFFNVETISDIYNRKVIFHTFGRKFGGDLISRKLGLAGEILLRTTKDVPVSLTFQLERAHRKRLVTTVLQKFINFIQ